MAGIRAEAKQRNEAAVRAAARADVAANGAVGLSMRRTAREVGLVSSAIYRYFPTRDALLTALMVESWCNLDQSLDQVRRSTRPDKYWADLAQACRSWALVTPHEFQLILGSPIPGYRACDEVTEAAGRVASRFYAVAANDAVAGFDHPRLVHQFQSVAEGSFDPSGKAAVLAELTALIGFVSLELTGQLVPSANPADWLFAALLSRQIDTLGLATRG